jgi:V-type H+-transporting ATPase subunit G
MDKVEKIAKRIVKKDGGADIPVQSMAENSQMIALLIEAEKKASGVIEVAKRRKAATLKKARDESTAELERYRKQLENDFAHIQKDFHSSKGQDADRVEKELQKKRADLGQAFKEHSALTLKHVLDIVINVNPEVHQNYRKD